jgi:hypothetical protein
MEMNSSIKAYVKEAALDDVVVWSSSNEFSNVLLVNGFARKEESIFTYTTTSDENKAKLFTWLRDNDVLFSDGREWNPSEVFEYLREKKLLSGSYQRITWVGQDVFQVRVC